MSRTAVKLLLLSSLAWAATGCGGVAQESAAGSFEPGTAGTLTVATAEVPAPGFWEGRPAELTGGFEYELAGELQQRFELDRLEVTVLPFSEITAGDLGGADLALAEITPTDERDQVLDFSDPYLSSPPALLTADGVEVPDLETARDLTFAVEEGTTLQTALEDSIEPTAPVIVTPDQDTAVAAVADGDADAALLDLPAAAAIADRSDGELAVAAKLGTDETVAAALPEGAEMNAEAVSSAIRAMDADGTLAELSDRWLGSEITAGAPNVPLLRTSR